MKPPWRVALLTMFSRCNLLTKIHLSSKTGSIGNKGLITMSLRILQTEEILKGIWENRFPSGNIPFSMMSRIPDTRLGRAGRLWNQSAIPK
ncbi:hypothetical protein F4808DRAFT_429133 [Astrocystis sublimbata]|nr:hypothetical protein F4808DRAFT_429133 [Astrocystis sublimbata]